MLIARVGKPECPLPGQWGGEGNRGWGGRMAIYNWRQEETQLLQAGKLHLQPLFWIWQNVVLPTIYVLQFSFWFSLCSKHVHCTLSPDALCWPSGQSHTRKAETSQTQVSQWWGWDLWLSCPTAAPPAMKVGPMKRASWFSVDASPPVWAVFSRTPWSCETEHFLSYQ